MLTEEYGFCYFKLDDYLERYLDFAKNQGAPYSLKAVNMSTDELWLRDPKVLAREELAIYEELFQFAQADIRNLDCNKPIIAEGAGFLPNLVKAAGIAEDSYICIVPTKEFQYKKYSERDWVSDILKDSCNKEQAFINWMERDVLFAESVRNSAVNLGYKTILVSESSKVSTTYETVKKVFGL